MGTAPIFPALRPLFLLLLCAGCVSFTPGPACDAGPESCPAWSCECGVGRASASACAGGRCAEAAAVCKNACTGAGSCWQGRATGGWLNGNSVGTTYCTGGGGDGGAACGDRDFADLGKPCTATGECASGICLGNVASFICAKTCASNAQCPAGWVCGTNSLGGTTCFIGAPDDEGDPTSMNASCKQVAFTDIGMACTTGAECQSKICFGSAANGFFCSRRCNDDALCAAGFRCVTSAADTARFCEKQ